MLRLCDFIPSRICRFYRTYQTDLITCDRSLPLIFSRLSALRASAQSAIFVAAIKIGSISVGKSPSAVQALIHGAVCVMYPIYKRAVAVMQLISREVDDIWRYSVAHCDSDEPDAHGGVLWKLGQLYRTSPWRPCVPKRWPSQAGRRCQSETQPKKPKRIAPRNKDACHHHSSFVNQCIFKTCIEICLALALKTYIVRIENTLKIKGNNKLQANTWLEFNI